MAAFVALWSELFSLSNMEADRLGEAVNVELTSFILPNAFDLFCQSKYYNHLNSLPLWSFRVLKNI